MGSIDYKKLYELQDEVLNVVFATEQVFTKRKDIPMI